MGRKRSSIYSATGRALNTDRILTVARRSQASLGPAGNRRSAFENQSKQIRERASQKRSPGSVLYHDGSAMRRPEKPLFDQFQLNERVPTGNLYSVSKFHHGAARRHVSPLMIGPTIILRENADAGKSHTTYGAATKTGASQ
jgi:hypothetical protein